jgi:hypothetical protein
VLARASGALLAIASVTEGIWTHLSNGFSGTATIAPGAPYAPTALTFTAATAPWRSPAPPGRASHQKIACSILLKYPGLALDQQFGDRGG